MSKCKECGNIYIKPCEHLNCLDVDDNCEDLREFVNGIRADAIDDVLFYLYDKNYINSDDEAYFRGQLKENL